MSKYQRMIIEALAPPFLGAFIFAVTGCGADSFTDRIIFFLPFLMAAYAYAIVPSLLYMFVMETWYWFGLHARCGLLCTAGLSALLGCGAGLAIEYAIDFGQILSWALLWIGSLVGLLIGFYVGRQQPNLEGCIAAERAGRGHQGGK